VIGVLGTIIGTITGALLSHFLNKKGKIDIIIHGDDYKDQKNNSNEYMYYLHMFISNNSSTPRYIRNIKLRFYGKNNTVIFESFPKTTKLITIEGLSDFGCCVDNKFISTFSFYGHEARDIVLCDIIEGHSDNLENVTQIKMSYEYKSKSKNKNRKAEITIISNFLFGRVGISTSTNKFSKPLSN